MEPVNGYELNIRSSYSPELGATLIRSCFTDRDGDTAHVSELIHDIEVQQAPYQLDAIGQALIDMGRRYRDCAGSQYPAGRELAVTPEEEEAFRNLADKLGCV